MNQASNKPVKNTFLAAIERPEGQEREAYLAKVCAEDPGLYQHVSQLLKVHAQAGDFLETRPSGSCEIPRPALSEVIEKPGDKIGHYKLLQEIGEGGCGVVYLAEQREPMRRRVALKVIKLGMDTKQVIARFEAERQALAVMDHPNIAKVLDAGTTATGRPYFVMELVRGTKITDYCDAECLSTEARLGLFIHVCHAIQHAHQKGIIHRDIKPSNILVTQLEGEPVPKVIDFGIAKATGGQVLTDKTLFTAFEQFIGTPAYMSPEQAELSGHDIDTRTDIYALGVLLYELLTGRTPFEQKELLAAGLDRMRRMIREQEPLRPSTRLSILGKAERTTVAKRRNLELTQLIHLVHGDLDWVVMKCLEKSPNRRYVTANALAEDISRHLRDEPIAARPPSKIYRLRKLVRRNKLVFAAGAAVAAALVLGLGTSTWLLFKERSAEQAQKQLQLQAQAQARKSDTVAQVWKEMLQGVGPSVALGRDASLLREILDKTAVHVSQDLKQQPEVEAELLSTLGDVYLDLGQTTNGAAMYQEALAIRRNLWGELNTNVANSLDQLGRALLPLARPDDAEALMQQALSIRTNLLGSENLQVADSLFSLGQVRYWRGFNSEAANLFQQSIAMQRKVSSRDDVQLAQVLAHLSLVLACDGRSAEAEKAGREGLAIAEAASRAELVWACTNAINFALARAFRGEGRYDEAEALFRQTLRSYRTVVGPEAVIVARSMLALASVLQGKHQLDEAESLAREAICMLKRLRSMGAWLPTGLTILGDVLLEKGQPDKAEAAYREAIAMFREEGHPAVVPPDWLGALCKALLLQGKFDEFEAFCREWVIVCDRNSPESIAAWEDETVDLLLRNGKAEEVQSLCNKLSKVVTTAHVQATICELRADTYGYQGKADKAMEWYRKGIQTAPADARNYLKLAATLAWRGDKEGYNSLCSECLERFRDCKDADPCSKVAKACLILPNPTARSLTVSNWARLGLDFTSALPWTEATMEHAEYRLGNFPEAVKWGEKRAALDSPKAIKIQILCVLAMARYQLNDVAAAQEALANAIELSSNLSQTMRYNEKHDGLIAQLLLREAKALIEPGSSLEPGLSPSTNP